MKINGLRVDKSEGIQKKMLLLVAATVTGPEDLTQEEFLGKKEYMKTEKRDDTYKYVAKLSPETEGCIRLPK